MENLGLTHDLPDAREKSLDRLIEEWGSDVLQDWVRRYGNEVVEGGGIITQMWRTSLITICRVRQTRAVAEQAMLKNAIYGNRNPGITDAMLETYREEQGLAAEYLDAAGQ